MFDAVIVGARCAGAATAFRLARQGHRVLLIDQARLPADMPLSTHLLWHAGVDILARWGLLPAVRASNCPDLTAFSLDLGELVLAGRPPGTQMELALAPRRHVLDGILLDAALDAGVQFEPEVAFENVLRDDAGRVVGIQAQKPDGQALTVHARLVIGADGRHSQVARAVGSQGYHEFPKEAGSYNAFAYFSGVPLQGVEFYSRPERMAYAWATNDGLALVGLMQPAAAPRGSRPELDTYVRQELHAISPSLAARLAAGRRETDWLGGAIATGCRQPAGPGWALVGDAGITFDPITAAGITNALRDADLLAELADDGLAGQRPLDEALAEFQPRRDAVSVPLHLFAQDMARLAPPTEEVIQLFGALAGQPAEIDRYYGVFGQTVPPAEFFAPDNLARILQAGSPAA